MKFPCKSCGECCRHVWKPLDRGDGVCRHYDEQTNLCTVYESRPLLCNVDRMDGERFHRTMSAKTFYMAQAKGCVVLKADNADMPGRTETALRATGLFDEEEVTDFATIQQQIAFQITQPDLLLANREK